MYSNTLHPSLHVCPSSLVTLKKSHLQFFKNTSNSNALTQPISTLRLQLQFEQLLSILSILIAVRLVQRKLTKRRCWIDTLPGPPSYPFVGGLLLFSKDLTKAFENILTWYAKYGPIYRFEGLFNEPFIFFNDANHIQAILSSNHIGVVSKPHVPYDNIFGQFLKNGLLVSKGEYWKTHRRIVSRAFTYRSFSNYIKIFNQYSKRLVIDLVKQFPNDNLQPKQISELIHCCSLQIICASVMGMDLADSKEGAIFNEKFQRYKIISSQRAVHFWYMIDFFWKLHPISKEYTDIINTLNSITRKIIDNRRSKNFTQSNDHHDHESVEEDDGKEDEVGAKPCRSMIDEMLLSDMSPDEVLVEANTVIAAGFESTSLTIHYMLFLLALNPECQRECQDEIDELFNDPIKCVNGDLTMDALSDLKYLERCSLETLRLFPVIFLFQRKVEVPVKIDDNIEIPAGCNVSIPTYALHRNPKYFKDPDLFYPDRFLPENNQKRHPYAFIPFSAGIRNCVGYKFALLEIKAMVAHVLRNFEVSTVDKLEDVPILPSIVMTPVRDYKFVLKRRRF